jgi:hypothetical protein
VSIPRIANDLQVGAGNHAEIVREFPQKSIHRSNTGYALAHAQ